MNASRTPGATAWAGWLAVSAALLGCSACQSEVARVPGVAVVGDAQGDTTAREGRDPKTCAAGWLVTASALGPQCAPDVPVWGALALSPAAPVPVADSDATLVTRDNGRQWLIRPNPEQVDWQAARAACAQVSVDGHGDWHLPTLAELQSVVDYQRSQPASQLPLQPSAWYWSASPATGTGQAWGVAMASGLAGSVAAETKGIALCVRSLHVVSPQIRGRFQVSVDQHAVFDRLTGLTWQRQGDASGLQPYDYAQTYCHKLDLLGGGWRTPTVVELASLVDRRVQPQAIDADVFAATRPAPYWTSTPFAGVALYAWYVEFLGGSVRFDGDRTYTYAWVRCVR